jgi:hypothetical protein
VLAICLHIFASSGTARASSTADVDARTATFVYQFAMFVAWPASAFLGAHDPIVVGVVSSEATADAFDRVFQGKSIKGRRIVARRLSWASELRTCHLLFVPVTEAQHVEELPTRLEDAPVLTMSDDQTAARRGSVVAFALQNKRVNLEINVDRARLAGVGISSRVLRLARIRRGGDL